MVADWADGMEMIKPKKLAAAKSPKPITAFGFLGPHGLAPFTSPTMNEAKQMVDEKETIVRVEIRAIPPKPRKVK